jgi:hypothetical protein
MFSEAATRLLWKLWNCLWFRNGNWKNSSLIWQNMTPLLRVAHCFVQHEIWNTTISGCQPVRAGGIGSHTGNARMDGDWCLLLKNLSVFMLAGERQEDWRIRTMWGREVGTGLGCTLSCTVVSSYLLQIMQRACALKKLGCNYFHLDGMQWTGTLRRE